MALALYGDYLSIDEILADEVKFPCKLEVPLYQLGFIDPKNGGNSAEDVQSGTKLELPYWLAKDLCNRTRNIVSVDKPLPFKNVFKEIMRADSTAMDLSKHSLHYYGYGLRCSEFGTIPDNDDVREALMECFVGRFRMLADLSMNSMNSDIGAITVSLDVTEKNMFQHGQGLYLNYHSRQRL